MEQSARNSALGPVLFAGLTVYTVMAQAFLPEGSDPADRMDMKRATRATDMGHPALPGALPDAPGPEMMVALADPSHTVRPTNETEPPVATVPARPDWAPVPAQLDTQETGWRQVTVLWPTVTPVARGRSPNSLPDSPRLSALPAFQNIEIIPKPFDIVGFTDLQGQLGIEPLTLSRPSPVTPPRRAPIRPHAATALAAFQPPKPDLVEVTGDFVHLREGPGGSGVLSILPRGTRAQILETRGPWVRLHIAQPEQATGWMYGDYLRPVSGP